MSTELSTYVGPYLECRPEQIPSTETIRACPNPRCDQHGKHSGVRYCGSCSRELQDRLSPDTQDAVDAYEAAMAIREALACVEAGDVLA